MKLGDARGPDSQLESARPAAACPGRPAAALRNVRMSHPQ